MTHPVNSPLQAGCHAGMVSVFKTDVTSLSTARAIMKDLLRLHPDGVVSFDLQDCDRVLRIEDPRQPIVKHKIANILLQFGHHMEILQ